MDQMGKMRRTCYCGEVTAYVGKNVVVCGFVQKVRNLGNLIFVDLRDRTGIVQLAFNDKTAPEIFEKVSHCHSEYVLMAAGEVTPRSNVNPEMKTGSVEIMVTDLRVLSAAQTPPFAITDETNVNEELRLKYRYLDLRRLPLQENLMVRHKIAAAAREYFYANGFLEIETPMLMKSTPEGARDYLVPSRIHHGKFYALPQSPQIYKQLLMVSGLDRYLQITRCFRDEDLRADRQPEFTQIDLEMSFVDVEDLLQMTEGFLQHLFHALPELGQEISLPLPRLTYREAMERYGSDKPDTRFEMEIQDISEVVRDVPFPLFQTALETGGSVRAIVAKSAAKTLTRKEIDKLSEFAKGIGAKGLFFIRWQDVTPTCSFAKFLPEGKSDEILSALDCAQGDVVLICADQDKIALPVLGAIRLEVAKKLNLIPEGKFNFLWITEFPFFEWNAETQHWDAMHHPFTMPMDDCIPYLESDPGRVTAKAFDLVLNGTELSSGSIRITDPELQERMFRILGLTPEEIEAKFGFLVEAYHYGAPPHGGLAIGLDRLAMTLTGAGSLRDVVAFPKVQNASELMSQSPAEVDAESLDVLGISIANPEP